jgi:OOP family OmpA-OmpF porin
MATGPRSSTFLRGAGIALVVCLPMVACSDDDTIPVGSSVPPSSVHTSTSAPPTTGPGALDDARFELWLRQKLSPPALPSFAVPLDAFVGADDRALSDRLDLPPGLYEGIAVVDARCDDVGDAVAADASGVFRGRDGSGEYHDGDVAVVVEGDGSGSFTDGTRTITIESDGSGSYQGESLLVEIESDGSGRFDDGERTIEVDSDRSGSYADADVAITVGSTGSATYRDATTFVDVSPNGDYEVQGDDAHADVVARVLREGLPLFPPVPHLGPVPEVAPGRSCGSVIRIDANVLFEFDSDAIAPDAAPILDRVGALLVALGSPALRIDGHTDAIGSDEYNLDLSARRAENVRAALGARGVDAASMTVRGLGESQPIAPNSSPDGADDAAGRRLNRRVELVILEAP